jgi:copper chaperone CopZ
MTKSIAIASAALFALTAVAFGQQPSPTPNAEAKPTKASFLITGLHCPPCTETVESSLKNVKGVVAIKVDWKTKSAAVEFDEAVLPAQPFALLVAKTPHMMGGNLHYAAWLVLYAPEIKDEATGKSAQEALSHIKGVKQAVAYPKQHCAAVLFDAEGGLTTQQLVEVLTEAGFKAEVH